MNVRGSVAGEAWITRAAFDIVGSLLFCLFACLLACLFLFGLVSLFVCARGCACVLGRVCARMCADACARSLSPTLPPTLFLARSLSREESPRVPQTIPSQCDRDNSGLRTHLHLLHLPLFQSQHLLQEPHVTRFRFRPKESNCVAQHSSLQAKCCAIAVTNHRLGRLQDRRANRRNLQLRQLLPSSFAVPC